ncbi:MAG: hypothetical protein IJ784_14235 [Ruminiclostridium sp.]|nr:hypothetical protein [Ruminiclostridium sp.]
MTECISYYDIISMNENGITFKNGKQVIFFYCIGRNNYYSEKCIGERNALADPPYVEFFTGNSNIRVVFDKTGMLEKKNNQRDFAQFHIDIQKYGYTTFNLS